MAAGVRILGVEAEVIAGVWTCEEPRVERLLNSIDLPSGYYPDRDLSLAEYILEQIGIDGDMILWCEVQLWRWMPPDTVF